MARIICLIVGGLVLVSASSAASRSHSGNSLLPEIDKRVELVCIAARLAGIKGFIAVSNPRYSAEISRHFGPFSNHPLIKYLKEKKSTLDEATWEIPAVAVHLSQPPALMPLMAYGDLANVDGWESRELFNAKFVGLLQQFYRDTNAERFFRTQATYYQLVTDEYRKRAVWLNRGWLERFFGLETKEEYFAIIGLNITGGAYMRVNFANNARHTITIFDAPSVDPRGIPNNLAEEIFPRQMLHEYIHGFTNQLVDQNLPLLQSSSETMLRNPRVFKLVEKTFYGNWQYLLYESLVRACSLKYMKANPTIGQDLEKEIVNQEKVGFLWIRGLMAELDEYEANRGKYRDLQAFLPHLIAFFQKAAADLNDYSEIK